MQAFMKALRDAPPRERVFLFYGPERYIWRKALDHLQRHAGKPLQRVDASEAGPREVARYLSSGLFGTAPLLWVDHVEAWKSSQWEEILPLVARSPAPVVFTSEEDLRPPRDFPGEVVPFPALSRRSLERWVRTELRRRGLSLTPVALRFLLDHVRGERLEKVARVLDTLELYAAHLDLPDLMAVLPGLETQIWALGDALMEGDRRKVGEGLADHGGEERVVQVLKHTVLKDLLTHRTGGEIRLRWKETAYRRWDPYFPDKDLIRLWHHLTVTQVVARNQGRFPLALREALLRAMRRTYQSQVEPKSPSRRKVGRKGAGT